MQKNPFLLLKTIRNTSSAQLWRHHSENLRKRPASSVTITTRAGHLRYFWKCFTNKKWFFFHFLRCRPVLQSEAERLVPWEAALQGEAWEARFLYYFLAIIKKVRHSWVNDGQQSGAWEAICEKKSVFSTVFSLYNNKNDIFCIFYEPLSCPRGS